MFKFFICSNFIFVQLILLLINFLFVYLYNTFIQLFFLIILFFNLYRYYISPINYLFFFLLQVKGSKEELNKKQGEK